MRCLLRADNCWELVIFITANNKFPPFYHTSQFADSEEVDFLVWFSPRFLVQWMTELMEPFHCFEQSNSSLVLTSL